MGSLRPSATGSAGARAGLRPARSGLDGSFIAGDVLVGLDGRQIDTVEDMYCVLDEHKAGDQVSLSIRRNGELMNLQVQLDSAD